MVGAGRLGTSLALALCRRGATLTGFVCATDEGRSRAAARLGRPAAADVAELAAAQPTHYLLTVPDAVLPAVATQLAAVLPAVPSAADAGPGRLPAAPVVLHTSGATSVEVLDVCAAHKALTLAFHPLQTFSEPDTGSQRFAGAAVAVTPPSGPAATAATEAGFALAHALEMRPFLLPDAKRTLYHAAASVASNYLVTLEYCARRLFTAAGMPEDEAVSLFLPLARAALENVGAQGPVAALTGPLSRGDAGTIAAHLGAIAQDAPTLVPLYRCLGLLTLDLVQARGDVPPATLDQLARLLRPSPCDPSPCDPSSCDP